MEYCLGGGFNAYCTSSLAVVKDASFLLTVRNVPIHLSSPIRSSSPIELSGPIFNRFLFCQCENVVVPAFVEYLVRHHGRINTGEKTKLFKLTDFSLCCQSSL